MPEENKVWLVASEDSCKFLPLQEDLETGHIAPASSFCSLQTVFSTLTSQHVTKALHVEQMSYQS